MSSNRGDQLVVRPRLRDLRHSSGRHVATGYTVGLHNATCMGVRTSAAGQVIARPVAR